MLAAGTLPVGENPGKERNVIRHIQIGGLHVFALTDCTPAPAACTWSFPDAELSGQKAARWFPGGRFATRFGPFLLRGDGADTLVDCGMGPGPSDYFPGLTGALPAQLAACGSALDRIGTVVFTHLHIDHVGWAPFLPQARFVVAAAEWAHWSGPQAGLPHHMAAVARCVAPLEAAGRLDLVAAGEQRRGLELLPTPGHTPGHHAVLVRDALLIAGDLWHNPAQIEVPAWCHRADMDKPRAIETRTRMADRAAAAAWLVAAGHFTADLVFGRIAASGAGNVFAPLP
jgi:glyoxylase-like metal-dependent hydrolase (beta-lactamase superfamily II)